MKDTNKEQTVEWFEKYKGQFVIRHSLPNDTVVRFIGIGYDNMDYLCIYYDGRKLSYDTILGHMIPLRGYIDDKYYNEYIRLWNLNSYDRPNDGRIEEDRYELGLKAYREGLEAQIKHSGITLLADLCWELN